MNILNEHVRSLVSGEFIILIKEFCLDRVGMDNDLPTGSDIERDLETRRLEVMRIFSQYFISHVLLGSIQPTSSNEFAIFNTELFL